MKGVRLFIFSMSIVFIILLIQPQFVNWKTVNTLLSNIYLTEGNINKNLERYEDAIADYNRAINLSPNDYFAYIDRGTVYRTLKQYQSAIEDFSQAIKLGHHNSYLAYANRGYTYGLIENHQNALSDYNIAINLKPNTVSVLQQRGHLYNFEFKKYTKALSDYDKVLELEPQNTEVYIARGMLYHALKNYSKAISDYERALELNALLGYAALNNLGLIQYELNNPEKAIAYWRKTLKINRDLEESKLAIAVAMYQQGEKTEAIQQAEQVLKLDNEWVNLEFLREQLWGESLIKDTQELFQEKDLKYYISLDDNLDRDNR